MDHLLLLLLLWSSGLGAGGSLASAAAQCEGAKADIMMLVDESSSISPTDFRTILKALEEIINTFDIGPDTVQIGLTLFADTPRTMWDLNSHQTKQSLMKAVYSLDQRGGSTYTGLALKRILRYSFKPNMGMRPDSRKILIIFTDGDSTDDVELPAKRLRDRGIEVYAIGIGDVSHRQLLMMTTDVPHMYTVKDFSSLLEILNNLAISLCDGTRSRAAQCEAAKADIMMLVDESTSISPPDFGTILKALQEIINTFDIGPDMVQIGLTLFADNPRTMWDLNSYQTKQSLMKAVYSLDQRYGSTYTGLALKRILRYSFKPNMGMRPDSRKILVIFTDGDSTDDVELPAKHLRDSGIEVYAIGIGDVSHSQLLMMTTDVPHMYIVKDFSSLLEILNNLAISLCDGTRSRAAQCEAAKADIMMLVDESSSISPPDFRTILKALEEIINTFDIGPDTVQIGLTLFADTPRTMWDLNSHQTKQSLMKAVNSLDKIGGSTFTGLALKHILRYSFKPNMGMRQDSRKILVIFTDGESADDVELPAKYLRDSGIEVYAIGIRDFSYPQLLMMTTDVPHMYIVEDFSSLSEILNKLAISLCDSARSRDSVRLVNGTSECSGRLEVKSNQPNQGWFSVCEADFDPQDAEVVCRELSCGALSVLRGVLYGEVEAPWWTKEFQCVGRESALMDCTSSDRNTCSSGRAAGLTCSEPVRLMGGASRCAGVLQVKVGKWRMVDASNSSLKAAAACRELNCGSAVSVDITEGSSKGSSEQSVWWISSDCVQAGYSLKECASADSSSSILNIACSDLLEQPVISVSSMGAVSGAQQQRFQVSWGYSFTLSCTIQPQYPGGSFQLSFTSSNTTITYTQTAVNHSADFLFSAAELAHRGNYTCIYHVHVFSHNFSSESRRLSLDVSDPTVFFIRLLLLLLSLLLFTSLICFSHKAAKKHKRSPQEDVEAERLVICRAKKGGGGSSK